MTTIEVNASKKYNVIIGSDLLAEADKYIRDVSVAGKIAVITDDIVDKLYFDTLNSSLKKYTVVKFVLKNGEESKNAENYAYILEFLAENHITRSDTIIALGGGVVGDIAGFAAATYLRGIKFIQIPTTLLAAVDSSVGGKTAIDLKAGKNLAGAFYQPSLVLCDYSTLVTLKPEVFTDGCAEVIKYSVIGDKELFNHLLNNGLNFDLEYVISKCVQMKSDIVCNDEFDNGERQLLNLGHTIGHSIEKCSNFKISHGSAVAIGLAMIARACFKFHICNEECKNDIIKILNDFNLPVKADFTTEELYNISLSDKKRSGNNLNLIVPEEIGKSVIKNILVTELKEYIKAGNF